jgi:hypothetical protein
VEGRLDATASAQDRAVDGSIRPGAVTTRIGVHGVDGISSVPQHRGEEVPDEPVPDDEGVAAGNVPHTPQHARERLDHRAVCVVDRVRKLDPPLGTRPLGESSRAYGRRGEALAQRLMACRALAALTAGLVMDEGDPSPVRDSCHDLVAEHLACTHGVVELLHVRPAQSAGEHVDQLSLPFRFRHVGELGLPLGP